jgi:hypothetical protein
VVACTPARARRPGASVLNPHIHGDRRRVPEGQRERKALTFYELAGCEFQAPQKCLRLIKVYAINFMP